MKMDIDLIRHQYTCTADSFPPKKIDVRGFPPNFSTFEVKSKAGSRDGVITLIFLTDHIR